MNCHVRETIDFIKNITYSVLQTHQIKQEVKIHGYYVIFRMNIIR